MKIEGFRERLDERKIKEFKLNPCFSGPEASASAAIEVLQGIGGRVAVEYLRGNNVDIELLEEIDRRSEIIRESRAYKSAAQKELRRVMDN